MRVLLTSAGRRPYLVKWFKDGLTDNGIEGEVLAADTDPLSPAAAFADHFVQAPMVSESNYHEWLRNVLRDEDINLAVSINDFELSKWSQLPNTPEWQPLIRLQALTQAVVEDKLAMNQALEAEGILTPCTWLGNDIDSLASHRGGYITKGRFGSASRGLRFTDHTGLRQAVESASKDVTTRSGVCAPEQSEIFPSELVVVQEQIRGVEYGLDVVCDFTGRFAGVLARRKIAMRAGETDRAVTANPATFTRLAKQISQAVPHTGTIDVDVIVDDSGKPFVIDINPRFGGGYPFSHIGGARVPSAYVAWALGRPHKAEWFDYAVGTHGGKYVETVAIP